jgi:hypothetical protein
LKPKDKTTSQGTTSEETTRKEVEMIKQKILEAK